MKKNKQRSSSKRVLAQAVMTYAGSAWNVIGAAARNHNLAFTEYTDSLNEWVQLVLPDSFRHVRKDITVGGMDLTVEVTKHRDGALFMLFYVPNEVLA